MADNFDLKKFLVENNLGAYSKARVIKEEQVNEAVNPEGDKLVKRFLSGIAQKFEYPGEDPLKQAAIFVAERLKRLGYLGSFTLPDTQVSEEGRDYSTDDTLGPEAPRGIPKSQSTDPLEMEYAAYPAGEVGQSVVRFYLIQEPIKGNNTIKIQKIDGNAALLQILPGWQFDKGNVIIGGAHYQIATKYVENFKTAVQKLGYKPAA